MFGSIARMPNIGFIGFIL
jgi:hypothetical protein